MKNRQTIIVYDFETGSVDPRTTEPLQLAAIPINPSTLEIDYKNIFKTYMRPKNPDNVQDKALAVNGIKREDMAGFPDRSIAWKQFEQWIRQFNRSGKYFDAPIAVGHNMLRFDWIIYERLCREFGNTSKDGTPNLFSNYISIDTIHLMWFWFESTDDLPKYKMDVLRPYFGLSSEGGHNAEVDVKQTAEILVRFMKFHRELYKKHGQQFKGCFSKSK